MILSKDELCELTGYRRPSLVLKILREYGVPVLLVGADDWPRVLRSALISSPKTLTKSEPNLFALKDLQRGMQNGTRKNKTKRPT